MLMGGQRGGWSALPLMIGLGLGLLACAPTVPPPAAPPPALNVDARPVTVEGYPRPGRTYLSFDRGHGFQVNFLDADGRAWLWYPGNRAGVPERWRVDPARDAICWTHPNNTYNPVTKTSGGQEVCQALDLSRSTLVAALLGDPFDLATGKVPYRLDRCAVPEAFVFDRSAHGCGR